MLAVSKHMVRPKEVSHPSSTELRYGSRSARGNKNALRSHHEQSLSTLLGSDDLSMV